LMRTSPMAEKKVPLPLRPTPEAWVQQGAPPAAAPVTKVKRLTVDIPADLHKALRQRSLYEYTTLQALLTRLLEEKLREPAP
jgi:hypothetical protein